MVENPRRGRQARNFTTNAPEILDLKSSSEQIFSRKLPLGAPAQLCFHRPCNPSHGNDFRRLVCRRNTYEQYGGYNLFQNAEFKANVSIKV